MKNKLTEEKIEQLLLELIEEGLFDRLKSKATGAVAGLKQTGKNLGAFLKGDASAIGDPKLQKATAQLKSKLDTIAKDLSSAQEDMATLFPAATIKSLPGDLPTIISNYQKSLTVMGNATKKIISQISNPPKSKEDTKQPEKKAASQPTPKGKQPQQKAAQQKQPNRNPATGRFTKKGEPARDPKTGRFVKKTLEELLKQYK
jgi:hypothetical protein